MTKLGFIIGPIGTNFSYWNKMLNSQMIEYSAQGIYDMMLAYSIAADDLGCKRSKIIQISNDYDEKTRKVFDMIHNSKLGRSVDYLGYYAIDGSEAYLLKFKGFSIIKCEVYGYYTYFLTKRSLRKFMKLCKEM